MYRSRVLVILFCIALVTTPAMMARADDVPVLAVLEYSGGLFAKRADIKSKMGMAISPYAKMPRDVWMLREGETLKQANTPPARFIQFFQQSGDSTQLLCNIVVRYVRGQKGWRPAYLLLQQSPVDWDGEKVVPRTGMSAREPVQLINPTDAAGNGFYHNLGFGLAARQTQITSWGVQ